MMTENTTSNEFARGFLENPLNSVIFVGYAATDSPAGEMLATEPGGEVTLNTRYPAEKLNCDVHRLDFSGHATRDELRKFAQDVSPKKIILVHGDMEALEWFKENLSKDLPDTEIIIPESGVSIEL